MLGAHNNPELLHMLREPHQPSMPTLRFSPRGEEVFRMLHEGMTNKRISERLGIGVSGVRRHKEKMLLQNNCATILELIAKYNGAASHMREREER